MGGFSSYGEIQYRLNYEASPITLIGGIAGAMPGGAIGIVNLLLGNSFAGLTVPGSGAGLNTFGITFMPLPGSTVLDNQIATYPFANIIAAASAIINQPLAVSMLMRIPVSLIIGGNMGRAAVFQSMVATLQQHVQAEGTFVVNTPLYPWSNCIGVKMTDVSGGDTKVPQVEWKLDFFQPLISASDGYSMNSVMGDIASGGLTDGTPANVSSDPATVSSTPALVNNNIAPGAAIDNGPGGGAGFGIGAGGGAIGG